MSRYLSAVAAVALVGCATQTVSVPEFPHVRDYRAPGDECFLVGESADTVEYLDDSADLVACPTDYEGRSEFVAETGAIELDSYAAFTLYSVPLR